jgi:hypothetical protein
MHSSHCEDTWTVPPTASSFGYGQQISRQNTVYYRINGLFITQNIIIDVQVISPLKEKARMPFLWTAFLLTSVDQFSYVSQVTQRY